LRARSTASRCSPGTRRAAARGASSRAPRQLRSPDRPKACCIRVASCGCFRKGAADALRLVPSDAMMSASASRAPPRLGKPRALAGRAARCGGVPRKTVHACTSWCSSLTVGAGARVMMSPLTVLARISTSGPSVVGVSHRAGARVAADG
jgi:hypothetical protein